jgi:hypothetical protein
MKGSKIVSLVSVLSILCVLCVNVAKANNEFNPFRKAYLNAVAQYKSAVALYENAVAQYNLLANDWSKNITRYRNIGGQSEALDEEIKLEEITLTASYPRMTTGTSVPVTLVLNIPNPEDVDSATIILLTKEGDEEGRLPVNPETTAFTLPMQAFRRINTTPNTILPSISNYMLEVNFVGGEQVVVEAPAKLMKQYFVRPVL